MGERGQREQRGGRRGRGECGNISRLELFKEKINTKLEFPEVS